MHCSKGGRAKTLGTPAPQKGLLLREGKADRRRMLFCPLLRTIFLEEITFRESQTTALI